MPNRASRIEREPSEPPTEHVCDVHEPALPMPTVAPTPSTTHRPKPTESPRAKTFDIPSQRHSSTAPPFLLIQHSFNLSSGSIVSVLSVLVSSRSRCRRRWRCLKTHLRGLVLTVECTPRASTQRYQAGPPDSEFRAAFTDETPPSWDAPGRMWQSRKAAVGDYRVADAYGVWPRAVH